MKITRIEAIPYAIKYAKPLHFASGMVDVADHVVVKVWTSDGVMGFADAPPRPYTYGETQKSIIAAIDELFAPQVIGLSILDMERIGEILHRTIGNHAAKGALDIALWDAQGKTFNQSVNSLLGGYATSLKVSHMLGFDEPQVVLDEALAMREKYGINAFKIKVGRLPVQLDLAVCLALRTGLGPSTELYVDANRGWTGSQAISALPALMEAGVSLLEEPCDAKDVLSRRRIVEKSSIPVVGDESTPSPGDVSRELLSGGCNAISIKTARGGFSNAIKILDLWEGLGVEVVMGNQIDTQIGTAATLAFGSARKKAGLRPAEMSNYLDMSDDLLATPLEIVDGQMSVSELPGVGIDLDEDKLTHYRQA